MKKIVQFLKNLFKKKNEINADIKNFMVSNGENILKNTGNLEIMNLVTPLTPLDLSNIKADYVNPTTIDTYIENAKTNNIDISEIPLDEVIKGKNGVDGSKLIKGIEATKKSTKKKPKGNNKK